MHLLDQQLNLMIRGEFDEAWKLCEQLEQETPDDTRHIFNRGWFLIRQGKFIEGYQALDAGRFLGVYGSPQLRTRAPIWDQSDLTGKTVILNLEGGYGDHMIFARFATEIAKRGATCILCGHHHLKGLLSNIEGVNQYISEFEVPNVPHDYWIPAFSAPWLLGFTHKTLPNKPYIQPNFQSVEVWKNFIKSDKIKVGIRWAGNPEFEHHQFRLFPPAPLINLNKYDNLQLYSFQRDDDTCELPDNIVDLQHLLISWDDTAAAIAHMDLVISSCTSIAHLAAAMGKPTWIITPVLPYHIWAYGKRHSPWYPKTTKLFRQTKFANWDAPFKSIERALVKEFNL